MKQCATCEPLTDDYPAFWGRRARDAAYRFQHAGFRVTRMPLQGHNDHRRLSAGGIIFWSGEQYHDA
jgi:hypothetical protein